MNPMIPFITILLYLILFVCFGEQTETWACLGKESATELCPSLSVVKL